MFEPLESRRLFSASLNFGNLHIDGTEGADNIRVFTRGLNVVVRDNGQVTRFAAAEVRNIVVSGYGGDDRIDCRGVRADDCEIYGFAGNDTLFGGRDGDELSGGDGNDRLYGMGGDDFLIDVQGDDRHFGGSGNDHMRDYVGNNRFFGAGGADEGTYVEGRTRVAGLEDATLLPPPLVVQPRPDQIEVTLRRSETGRWLADLEVSLPDSAHVLTTGTPARSGNDVTLAIAVEQIQGVGATTLIEVKRQTFDLGALRPGAYQFIIVSGGQAVETVSFVVA